MHMAILMTAFIFPSRVRWCLRCIGNPGLHCAFYKYSVYILYLLNKQCLFTKLYVDGVCSDLHVSHGPTSHFSTFIKALPQFGCSC